MQPLDPSVRNRLINENIPIADVIIPGQPNQPSLNILEYAYSFLPTSVTEFCYGISSTVCTYLYQVSNENDLIPIKETVQHIYTIDCPSILTLSMDPIMVIFAGLTETKDVVAFASTCKTLHWNPRIIETCIDAAQLKAEKCALEIDDSRDNFLCLIREITRIHFQAWDERYETVEWTNETPTLKAAQDHLISKRKKFGCTIAARNNLASKLEKINTHLVFLISSRDPLLDQNINSLSINNQ